MPNKTVLIDGRRVLSMQLRDLETHRSLFSACDVLLITPSEKNVPPATYVSAKEKVKVFTGLGFHVRSIMINNLVPEHWEGTRQLFYIAQNPICVADLPHKLIERGTNLDEVSLFPEYANCSAVVEAVMRCVDSANFSLDPIVVVGSCGRVGAKVMSLLANRGVHARGVDIGDDLVSALATARTVITATGSPGLIRSDALGPECRFVLDVGYHYDENTGEGCGDVSHHCYSLPVAISPVPGGIGPLQVLTLLERAVALVPSATYVPWKVQLDYY